MGAHEAKKSLISPNVAIVVAIVYSLITAFKSEFIIVDILPIAYLLALKIKTFMHVLIRLFYLQGFAIFIALSIYIFHYDKYLALIIFIRFNLIATLTLTLFYTKDSTYIYSGLANLWVPHKFKSLCFFFAKSCELLINDLAKLKETLKARGFVAKNNILSYQIISNILGLLVIKSIHRAQNLQETFIARGFNGELYSLNTIKITIYDYALIGTVLTNFYMDFF